METTQTRIPWNKGKIVGQKPALKLQEVWAIRVRLQLRKSARDLALFNLAIDSKLRGCDLVKLRVSDLMHAGQLVRRAAVVQQKTGKPVQFEVTEQTRTAVQQCSSAAVQRWIEEKQLGGSDYLFPSRVHASPHLTTRQYARVVQGWVSEIGLEGADYGTHSMRRTKASLIYRRTKNLRAVQLLLGHTKLESTVRYLGIEVDDALEIAEHMDI